MYLYKPHPPYSQFPHWAPRTTPGPAAVVAHCGSVIPGPADSPRPHRISWPLRTKRQRREYTAKAMQ